MIVFRKLFGTSVGRKAVMAVTGLGLIGFLVVHLSGNLLMFAGQDAMNSYAVQLRAFPALLLLARVGLGAIFIIHVALAIQLTLQNRKARPVQYKHKTSIQATVASRFMMVTGLLILFYLLYHLAHFTFGMAHSEYFHHTDHLGRPDVYTMVVMSFQQPIITIIYIIAMAITAVHLSHGLPSLFQSVGWNSPRFNQTYKTIGVAFATLLFIGYTSIPVAIWIGMVRLP